MNKCPVYPLAKKTSLSFFVSDSKVSMSFDLIHMDLWGPYTIQIFDKKYYFLTIVNDYSRCIWVYFLQLKSKIIVVSKSFFH